MEGGQRKQDTQKTQEPQEKQGKEEQNEGKDLKTGVFTVKEVKNGKSEGIVWAVATADDGTEVNICAKNGVGKALSNAKNKKAQIKYRLMSEGKIFAASVAVQK